MYVKCIYQSNDVYALRNSSVTTHVNILKTSQFLVPAIWLVGRSCCSHGTDQRLNAYIFLAWQHCCRMQKVIDMQIYTYITLCALCLLYGQRSASSILESTASYLRLGYWRNAIYLIKCKQCFLGVLDAFVVLIQWNLSITTIEWDTSLGQLDELQMAEIVSKSKLIPSVIIKTYYWMNHM